MPPLRVALKIRVDSKAKNRKQKVKIAIYKLLKKTQQFIEIFKDFNNTNKKQNIVTQDKTNTGNHVNSTSPDTASSPASTRPLLINLLTLLMLQPQLHLLLVTLM